MVLLRTLNYYLLILFYHFTKTWPTLVICVALPTEPLAQPMAHFAIRHFAVSDMLRMFSSRAPSEILLYALV